MLKKLSVKLIISIILLTTTLVVSFASYLSRSASLNNNVTLGEVSVEVDVYFLYDDGSSPDPVRYEGNVFYEAVSFGQGEFQKLGVYKVNLSNTLDPQYIKNLRVDIIVSSKVDTYLRVAAYEQLTLTYQSGGKTIEVATTQPSPMPFNYLDTGDEDNPYFYDNRTNDGYFYFTDIVKRDINNNNMKISFIGDFGTTPINIYEERYSLQLGFIIEAVQALKGPENNWSLPTRPWDDGVWQS